MKNLLTENQQQYVLDFFHKGGPSSAYWAGFLLADGTLSFCENRLSLVVIDKEHLIAFCNDLKIPDYLVKKRPLPIKDSHNQQWMVRISVNGLHKTLKPWGIIPNKSYEFQRPRISAKNLPHFLRGLTDGDGHISKKWSLVGQTDMMDFVKEKILDLGFEVKERSYSDNRPYKRISVRDRNFLSFISGQPRLERKWSTV